MSSRVVWPTPRIRLTSWISGDRTPLLEGYQRVAVLWPFRRDIQDGMGKIRKTMSVATLGLVNWNSTSELLERETEARKKLEFELADVEGSLQSSRRRRKKARKRADKAELEQLKLDKKLKRRNRRSEAKGSAKTLGFLGRRRASRAAKKARKAVGSAVDTATDAVT